MEDLDLIQLALSSNNPKLMQAAMELLDYPLRRFKPREDHPELLDEQSSFFYEKHPGIACCIAGNGAGKSYVTAAKITKFLETTPPPEPDTPFWVLSSKLEAVTKYAWGQGLKYFVPKSNIARIAWHRESTQQPAQVILKPHKNGNNYVLVFKSYDQGRESLQNANIIGFWCDEQAPWEVINEVLARTRKWSYPGTKLYTLTPVMPDEDLEKRFKEPQNFPSWKFYRMNTRQNKNLDPGFVKLIEEQEHPGLVETRLTGAFAHYEGMIFPTFGKQHVIEPFKIPDNWLRIRGLDVGFRHCTACLWCAIDPNTKRHYIYREYNKNQTDIESHVAAIQGRDDNLINPEAWEELIHKGATWADPEDAQVLHEFRLRQLHTTQAKKDLEASFATVRTLLRTDERDGKPLLQIFNTCPVLIHQMRTYVYEEGGMRPIRETDKRLFDVLACLRYLTYNFQLSQTPIQYRKPDEPTWKRHLKKM